MLTPKHRNIPVHTWQFYKACKNHLGSGVLTDLYKVSTRQVDRWSCDPDFASSSQRNPLDKVETLLQKLMDRGVDDMAVGAVDRLAHIVGRYLAEPEGTVRPDKPTLADELCDDLPVLATFQQAMRDNEPAPVVRDKYYRLLSELEENMVMYEGLKEKP